MGVYINIFINLINNIFTNSNFSALISYYCKQPIIIIYISVVFITIVINIITNFKKVRL